MSEDTRAETLTHIHAVRDRIGSFIAVMLRRAARHDASKFSPEEKPAFDRVIPLLRDVPYGSDRWREVAALLGPAAAHHFAHNSHHPQHYPEGIAGMDLFDLVEMLCDWMAAAERRPADGVRLDLNIAEFGIEPQLAAILANTLRRWPAAPEP